MLHQRLFLNIAGKVNKLTFLIILIFIYLNKNLIYIRALVIVLLLNICWLFINFNFIPQNTYFLLYFFLASSTQLL